MISCILLSAGHSSRFGKPKALAKINSQTVIDYLLGNLAASNLDEIIVVLGAQADEIKSHILKHSKVRIVYNKDYNLGQTSSFKAGVRAVQRDCKGIMLMPVDYPFVKLETINSLIEFFILKSPQILIPTFDRKRGHPPLFSCELKTSFLEMDNSVGINTLEHEHESELVFLPIGDQGVVETFNTQEEFELLKNRFL